MSILIKGMEMPKDCWHCRFADPEEGGCLVDQKTHGDWDEPDNCPLVPVPPHGRLIDADKMKESIREQTGFLKLMGGEMAEIAEVLEKGILQEIDNAPTIIPASEEGE